MTQTSTAVQSQVFPLGPLQEPIWQFWRQHPGSTAYIMPEVYLFDGEFDLAAATTALAATARRHESLRMTFHEQADGSVVQTASADPAHAPIEVVDLRQLSGAAQAAQLEDAITQAANATFDLTARPPIRLTAVLLSEQQTGLVLSGHQIICDGSSMAILVDDFGACYRAARAGTEPDLAPATPGYGAFVHQQLASLADEGFTEDRAYWSTRLAGASGSVLPGNHPATAEDSGLSTLLLSTTLDDALAAEVVSYARRSGSTPFAVLLGAMCVMIAAASGNEDVCLATSTSSRTPKYARTVGMLTNQVVLRSRVGLTGTFDDALSEVSMTLLDAIDFQEVPFSQVVDGWRDTVPATESDLVRTTFSAGASGGLTLGEGNLAERVARTSQGPFQLGVVCDITPAGIALDWQYALRTYSEGLAQRYCLAYEELLKTVLSASDTAISELGLDEILARAATAG